MPTRLVATGDQHVMPINMNTQLNTIEFPCLAGTVTGLIKIENIKEFRHWIHEFSLPEIAFIKKGFNEKLRLKFILSKDGKFREFQQKREMRSWAKYISFLIDFSKVECAVIIHQELTKEKIRKLFKRNITALDMHFPSTMNTYKLLKHGPQNIILTSEELIQLIEA